jgi:hypothetical protein
MLKQSRSRWIGFVISEKHFKLVISGTGDRFGV